MQEQPALWSTALMWIVAELFEALPEAGDLPQPKLVVFLDEAHLLFDDATEAFLEAIARTVRLIRSKGVGVFFVTQQPTDLSDEVLAQLGLRVQHALRAFTPADAKALRATVSTYPTSELYDVEELLTSVGIGEAAVTLLSERGVPTPVVHTRMVAPASRMGPADDIDGAARASSLWARYGDAQRRAERAGDPRGTAGARSRSRARRRRACRAPRRRREPRRAPRARAERRRGRHRRLPPLPRGQGAAAQGRARRVRDAAQAPLSGRQNDESPAGRGSRAVGDGAVTVIVGG